MDLLDQKIVGLVILFSLGVLVAVKRLATGSVLDRPRGNLLIQVVNGFNLFFLLIVNPLAALLLITRREELIQVTRLGIGLPWVSAVCEMLGLVIYLSGHLLMVWALITLGRHYQLGGSAPRSEDKLITVGPYRLIRHPMYTAALGISWGLVFLFQSWVFIGVFFVYLLLVFLLIPMEEAGLRTAYGERYGIYLQETRKIIPLVF